MCFVVYLRLMKGKALQEGPLASHCTHQYDVDQKRTAACFQRSLPFYVPTIGNPKSGTFSMSPRMSSASLYCPSSVNNVVIDFKALGCRYSSQRVSA